jgi:hypothetical protein
MPQNMSRCQAFEIPFCCYWRWGSTKEENMHGAGAYERETYMYSLLGGL